jgi:hypothetical protein
LATAAAIEARLVVEELANGILRSTIPPTMREMPPGCTEIARMLSLAGRGFAEGEAGGEPERTTEIGSAAGV